MFTLLSIQYQKHEAQFRLGSRNILQNTWEMELFSLKESLAGNIHNFRIQQ